VAEATEPHGQRAADVTGSDDSNVHGAYLPRLHGDESSR
jgi:hypothetical protein